MIEIWKDILGYEGYYQVSNLGNVRGIDRKVKSKINKTGFRIVKGKKISPHINKYGYLSIRLRKEGSTKAFTIHRLVAMTFIPNPNNYPSVNHIDENKLNNTVSNLEWCTIKYNNLYNNRQDRINEKLRDINPNSIQVYQYSKDGILLNKYRSIRDASRLTGINRSIIKRSCKNGGVLIKNYIWKFN